MAELSKWTIFSLLEREFVENVNFAVVFGNSGNEAIIVCKDDMVYGIGTNTSSCLGIGNGCSSLEAVRIDSLCNKGLSSLSFGTGPHVLGLTSNGEVFSWGHNAYCQLGNGNNNPGISPFRVVTNISQHRVVQVACGSYHSLVLTHDGDVYGWGQNSSGQVGVGTTTNQPTPRLVGGSITNRVVKSIVCGQASSYAVTDTGEVHSWGYNGNGQLGIGNTTNQHTPCQILEIKNHVIEQIVCGFAHALALTDEGCVFAWGSNTCGQIGLSQKGNQLIPIVTVAALGRIVQVAAVHTCNISAARTQNNKVFMWGQCRGQSIQEPQETRFSCTGDVFACFASPGVSWRPLRFSVTKQSSLQESIRVSFDDQLTSDLTFVVEQKPIYVHKALLKIRCHHFRTMFEEGKWSEADQSSIEITQFSYAVYRAFLYYLYTDCIDLSVEDAVGLLDLANSYCESALKEKCSEIIRRGITTDNVVILYAAALKFDVKDLEDFCFNFCLSHLTSVVQTEAFQKLDDNSLKYLIVEAARAGAFKH